MTADRYRTRLMSMLAAFLVACAPQCYDDAIRTEAAAHNLAAGSGFSRWIILALWLVFIIYWGISALHAKRSVRGAVWWRHLIVRLVIAVLIVITVQVPAIRHAMQAATREQIEATIGAVQLVLPGLSSAPPPAGAPADRRPTDRH